MMAPVKFGLVGYGFGGRYFHAVTTARVLDAAGISATTGAVVEVQG